MVARMLLTLFVKKFLKNVSFQTAKIEKNPIVKRENSNFAINKHVHEIWHYLPSCIPVG